MMIDLEPNIEYKVKIDIPRFSVTGYVIRKGVNNPIIIKDNILYIQYIDESIRAFKEWENIHIEEVKNEKTD